MLKYSFDFGFEVTALPESGKSNFDVLCSFPTFTVVNSSFSFTSGIVPTLLLTPALEFVLLLLRLPLTDAVYILVGLLFL